MLRPADLLAHAIQADPPVRIARAADALSDRQFESVPIEAHTRSEGRIPAEARANADAAVRHRAGETRALPELKELYAAECPNLRFAVWTALRAISMKSSETTDVSPAVPRGDRCIRSRAVLVSLDASVVVSEWVTGKTVF